MAAAAGKATAGVFFPAVAELDATAQHRRRDALASHAGKLRIYCLYAFDTL